MNLSRLVICFCLLLAACVPTLAWADKPNVLLIAIDDLNDWVGCLGGHPQAQSPNIDRLAQQGTLFTNAHCQAPICNPSRASIMYGIRPSTSGVYMNAPKPWTVKAMDDRVTMPRHFAANGYKTYTAGKIYHGSGLPPGDFDTVGPRPGQRQKIDKRLIAETKSGVSGLWDFGGQDYKEELFQDHTDATWTIDVLDKHDTKQGSEPFFVAVGFYRPHVPFYSPTRVFNQIPADQIELPKVKEGDRNDLPEAARKLTKVGAPPPHSWFVQTGRWKEAVQAYLACVRWTDEQVGRVIDALESSPHADNTIVVLYSDHGFFLGEKERWAKQSLWEKATHVPFIIRAPGYNKAARCSRPVELLSIYPTLVELCNLDARKELEGVSLKPLLQDPTAQWPHVALTTFGQNNHSTRSETHRYIRYDDGSEELYDLRTDPNEWNNIAKDDSTNGLKKELGGFFPTVNAAPARSEKQRSKKKK